MATLASLSSGVILTPSRLNNVMLSWWLINVPLLGPAYKSVRQVGVPAAYSCGVRALGLNPSILPRKDLNSAKVISLVRHSADAGAFVSALKGLKACVHLLARGVSNILVEVCRSFCA